jgi:hypothetical protein
MQIKTTCRFQLTSVRKHIIKNKQPGSARWYTSVIPALRRQKEDHKFKGSLDYVTLFERKREREGERKNSELLARIQEKEPLYSVGFLVN